MSKKTLDRDLAAAIHQITERYITSQEGTPTHEIKTKLAKKRDLLEEAAREGYLRNTGAKYFPCFMAVGL